MATVVARVPLTVAHFQKCSRHLKPGEVKRVMQRGPLQGYMICCPAPSAMPNAAARGEACGFTGTYLAREAGFVEDPPSAVRVEDPRDRRIVATTGPLSCFRCHRSLRVVDGVLEALDP
jgi:hypothetical protein